MEQNQVDIQLADFPLALNALEFPIPTGDGIWRTQNRLPFTL
jgi:hypothetical protein